MITGDKNGVVNGTTGKLSDGTKSINSSIDNGMPVIVGVDYKKKQKHNFKKYGGDGMTDHFILIMGKTETYKKGVLQGVKYRFFDPRTKDRNNGTPKQNTLSVTKGYLKGSYLVKDKNYAVTSIRETKKTK